jgi:hypothetical protein
VESILTQSPRVGASLAPLLAEGDELNWNGDWRYLSTALKFLFQFDLNPNWVDAIRSLRCIEEFNEIRQVLSDDKRTTPLLRISNLF